MTPTHADLRALLSDCVQFIDDRLPSKGANVTDEARVLSRRVHAALDAPVPTDADLPDVTDFGQMERATRP